jgi:hypothetical protein
MTVRPRPPSRLIFDVDSTVLVVYGKQEQARIGYNLGDPLLARRLARGRTPRSASSLPRRKASA